MADKFFSRIGNILNGNPSGPDSASLKPPGTVTPLRNENPRSSRATLSNSQQKNYKLAAILKLPQIDVAALREAFWSGCPDAEYSIRSQAWKVTLAYLPSRRDRQEDVISRKRSEYLSMSSEYQLLLNSVADDNSEPTAVLIRQIRVDIPRTCTNNLAIFSDPRIQRIMAQVLFAWAYRNPACGYVQGMNDITIPILAVLLQAHTGVDITVVRLDTISEADMLSIEADLYWMMSKLLQDLQDNYTFSQPGIQRMNSKLKEIVQRIEPELTAHFQNEQVDFMQITFRWFNCLLTREFEIHSLLRVWDTCISEQNGFSVFLVYLCAAIIVKLAPSMKQKDFQEIMMMISKNQTTSAFDLDSVETLLSEAFVLKSLFHSSPSHLQSPAG